MQTAIITGGNGGLGYQCALVIVAESPQWQAIIASRDHAKSGQAAELWDSSVSMVHLKPEETILPLAT